MLDRELCLACPCYSGSLFRGWSERASACERELFGYILGERQGDDDDDEDSGKRGSPGATAGEAWECSE